MLGFCSCKPGKASFGSNLRPKRGLSCLRPEYQQFRAQSLASTSEGSSFRIRPPVSAVYSPEQGTFGQSREYQRAPQSPAPLQQRSARQYQQSDLQQDPGRPSRQYWPDSQPSTSQYAPTYPDRTPQIDPRSQSYGQQRPMQPAFVRRRQKPRPRFSPPPEDETILSNNQIVNKQVITRVTGNSLGNISNFFVDPDTLRVVSAALRPKGFSLGGPGNGNLLLETFCQIGDVVLVHDESVLDLVPQDESVGFLDIIGCPIYTSQGDSLGKVRSFTFSPDSGKVDCLRYDALGWPAIPEKLVGVWEVGVECVEEVDGLARITLLPGTEAGLNRVSDGPLELAFVALQKLFASVGGDDDLEYGANQELDREFEKWRLQYAPYFLKHYGQPPPATRQELDRFYQDLNAPRQPVAAPVRSPARPTPAYLPPGRQERIADVLQASPVRETVARRPQQRVDPRMRSQEMAQSSDYWPSSDASGQAAAPPERRPDYQQSAGPSRGASDPNAWLQAKPLPQRNPPEQRSNAVASVPLYDLRPSVPASDRQDVDGGYGEPESAEYQNRQQQRFDDWVEATEATRQPVTAVAYNGTAYTSATYLSPSGRGSGPDQQEATSSVEYLPPSANTTPDRPSPQMTQQSNRDSNAMASRQAQPKYLEGRQFNGSEESQRPSTVSGSVPPNDQQYTSQQPGQSSGVIGNLQREQITSSQEYRPGQKGGIGDNGNRIGGGVSEQSSPGTSYSRQQDVAANST